MSRPARRAPRAVLAVAALTLALTPVGLAAPAAALPDFARAESVAGIIVVPDDQHPRRFYYRPGPLALAHTADGAPDLHLLSVRYVGTAAGGDQGTRFDRTVLSFRVRMDGPDAAALEAARTALADRGIVRPELRPLPIRRVEAALVYAPIHVATTTDDGDRSATSGEAATGPHLLPAGRFEATDAVALGSYWRERVYTLRLGAHDAQTLGAALATGRVLLSVAYAFVADGAPEAADSALADLSGSTELVAAIAERLDLGDAASSGATTDDGADEPAARPVLVRAGSADITLDSAARPDLLRRIDLNDRVPPGYAVLEVRCYDFLDRLDDTLFEKRVEILAQGVAGNPMRHEASFRIDQPDLYALSVRFPVAVRLDRPYRFRVLATGLDGFEREVLPWQEAASWSALLDVTARPEISGESS